uniref:BRICHOS domain-containing protein n=1 Tax=Ciona savignyi TaxID=51511 RepID=H2YQS0_CIOSA
MTACNKIDSIVKEDGSTEELLPTEKVLKPKCKVPTLKQKRAIIVLCFLFALLVAGATVFLVLHFINRPVKHHYAEPVFRCGTTFAMNGEMEKGEMEFNTTDQTERVITKNTEAKIDGLEGKTVVKLTDPDNEEICILRDDLKLGRAGPPILPRKELLAQFMQLNETLEVQMDDDVWFAYPDSDPTLPPTLSDMCEGKSLYGLSPISDADYQLMADYTEDKFEEMFDYFDNLT